MRTKEHCGETTDAAGNTLRYRCYQNQVTDVVGGKLRLVTVSKWYESRDVRCQADSLPELKIKVTQRKVTI